MIFLPQMFICIILFGRIATCAYSSKINHYETDCGARPARREPRSYTRLNLEQQQRNFHTNSRSPRIIAGTPTKEGQFPWQASLELLHPSLGFLGHWCGAVLIHKYWVLSAAHCVHNDLFNLPLAPLWTVVLGEHNRMEESGYEQRIPVEKIVLHKNYQNFLNDLVLMKLSKAANVLSSSNIRRICLPFLFSDYSIKYTDINSHLNFNIDMNADDNLEMDMDMKYNDPLISRLGEIPENMENFLRSSQSIKRRRQNITLPSMKELMSTKIMNRLKKMPTHRASRHNKLLTRRRNDKLMKVHLNADEYEGLFDQKYSKDIEEIKDLPYIDCVATGWGRSNSSGDLTDSLLKTNVPLQHNRKCSDAYGSFVKIHRGHLCAGKLNGKGGTCVGDSGGPLQCRISKNGPWILAGITSFGSGCALKGFPDVYTRTSFYMKWIQHTITNE